MTEQRFPAGSAPRVRIGRLSGDLRVAVWDDDTILVVAAGQVQELYQEGDEVVITSAGDLDLQLPARAVVSAGACEGDVTAAGVRELTLERVAGDLRTGGVGSLAVEQVAGDVRVAELAARLSAGRVGGDLRLKGATGATITVGSVAGDLELGGPSGTLQAAEIGGDCTLSGDCERVHVGQVGGDCTLAAVATLKVGAVRGDLEVAHASSTVEVGSVSGDTRFMALDGTLELGDVAGDLDLRARFSPASKARIRVGGDASIQLLGVPNLTLSAVVQGELRGVSASSGGGTKRISLVYGAGAASLELNVGGDLRISAEARPGSSSSSSGMGGGSEFERDWAELGRELGALGHELGAEIAAALSNEGVAGGAAWAEEVARKVEEQARRIQARAEEQARRAAARARGDAPGRVHVKINEREWQLDPERLERIKDQARRAAADGLAGALEAVERALGRMRVPPASPEPPSPAAPTAAPTPPTVATPVTGQTIRIEHEAASPAPAVAPAEIERERETILRMIAEGRISPEEGDLLLEALG